MDFVDDLIIIPRAIWSVKEPKKEEEIEKPAPYLVLYHDDKTQCKNRQQCTQVMKYMQKEHMAQGESDILYQ